MDRSMALSLVLESGGGCPCLTIFERRLFASVCAFLRAARDDIWARSAPSAISMRSSMRFFRASCSLRRICSWCWRLLESLRKVREGTMSSRASATWASLRPTARPTPSSPSSSSSLASSARSSSSSSPPAVMKKEPDFSLILRSSSFCWASDRTRMLFVGWGSESSAVDSSSSKSSAVGPDESWRFMMPDVPAPCSPPEMISTIFESMISERWIASMESIVGASGPAPPADATADGGTAPGSMAAVGRAPSPSRRWPKGRSRW
mmetsp:Transcript_14273/g.49160  ORF Transcript_14273/g.49160 Transcript_14273/m.49160 type:complete len:264 (-) Transcript_14273:99-890(-)